MEIQGVIASEDPWPGADTTQAVELADGHTAVVRGEQVLWRSERPGYTTDEDWAGTQLVRYIHYV